MQMAAEELIHLMTIMYISIQVALDGPDWVTDPSPTADLRKSWRFRPSTRPAAG